MKRLLSPFVALALVCSSAALASSHREAPFITRNPKVDGTDFYLFNSYETGRTGFVTVIANYQPLQDAYGGPNYFSMDPNALYEIHIDHTGDGNEDLTFQFRFQNTLSNNGTGVALPSQFPDGGMSPTVAIPLINAGAVGLPDGGFAAAPTGFQGQLETYSLTVVQGNRRTGTATPIMAPGGGTSFRKPLDNIGRKTFPGNSYANYAAAHVYTVNLPNNLAGGSGRCMNRQAKVFVGQRDDNFAVNLGTIFDLVNAPAALITTEASPCTISGLGTLPGVDGLSASCRNVVPNTIKGKNVTTLALEIPAECLTPTPDGVIGGWTTASVRQARVINPDATYTTPAREGGAWTQVSRLGMPLVNEVVIGVPDKDKFNTTVPANDAANFAPYVLTPTLPQLLNVLFMVPPPPANRTDLVTVFLRGIPGVNEIPGSTALAEMVRLNTNTGSVFAPRAPAAQNNLGALGCFTGRSATMAPMLTPAASTCDASGFPNGRRPGDDVVDIALRVVEGILFDGTTAPGGGIPFHDGVLQDARQFDSTFPYLKTPNPGS
ncbi:MAG: DUF4331 domain-containing protein [Myxococcaceae bacterium]|nr:DUF4331 domain-containing protein [Myxococcaceae bacterium]